MSHKMRRPLHVCTPCLHLYSPRGLLSARSITTTAVPPNSAPPSKHPDRIPPKKITPTQICYYWDTQAPTRAQLDYADKTFAVTRHSPIKKWSASKFRTAPDSWEPEVAFVGRSNVGKSTVLNRVMGREICYTSSKPGRTREMNAYGIGGTKGGESKVVVLDMPGYGKGGRSEWGREILKYIHGRKQLRRVFVLIDSKHGLKPTDIQLLQLFREYAVPHQVVLSKIDRFLSRKPRSLRKGVSTASMSTLREMLQYLRPIVQPTGHGEGPGALGELLTCCAGTTPVLGISELRWAILAAGGYGGSIEVKTDGKPPAKPAVSTSSPS